MKQLQLADVLTTRGIATRLPHAEARRIFEGFLLTEGYSPRNVRRITFTQPPGGNHKTSLNELPTWTLTLSQANTTQMWAEELGCFVQVNVCPWRTKQCTLTCLGPIGRGGEPKTRKSREVRVRFLAQHPDAACTLVADELETAVGKVGLIGARLNTLSDQPWELIAPWIFDVAGVTFYDYTKGWARQVPANYHLTRSASERTGPADIVAAVDAGHTVAVVFDVKHRPQAKEQLPLPESYYGARVIDGDRTDERFNDVGVVVGLRAKGKAASLPVGGFVKAAS